LSQLEVLSPIFSLDLSEINVYPNAFKDFLNIESTTFPILEYALMDAQGKIMQAKKGLFEQNFRLNTEGVPSGFYILQMKSTAGFKNIKVTCMN
jgi:Secretion system C-terminal sorting domain